MADHRSTASIKPMTYRKPAQMLCQLSYAVRSVRWSMRYFRTESSSFDINVILSVIIIFMYLHKNLDHHIVFYYIAPKCPNFLQTTGYELFWFHYMYIQKALSIWYCSFTNVFVCIYILSICLSDFSQLCVTFFVLKSCKPCHRRLCLCCTIVFLIANRER